MEIRATKAYFPLSANASVTAVRAQATAQGRAPFPTGGSGTATNRPTNPGMIIWNSSTGPASAWAHPGALVVAGREYYNDQVFHDLAAAGATVLIYLHPHLMNTVGRYHDMLYNASQFGGAVPGWPNGPWVVDEYGNMADFRVGSLLQTKLVGVMNLMVSENPHISGFFLDGLGTRATPGTGGFTWEAFPDKQQYRDGAIAQAQTARTIANANNLFLMVNSNWQAGDLTYGGGYPDANQHGCSLVDGMFIENHSVIDAFWTSVCNSPQWGTATGRNKAYMWASPQGDTAARDTWANSNLVAWASSSDYSSGFVTPWRATFTDFHIPHR